jgi:hypothetical protein
VGLNFNMGVTDSRPELLRGSTYCCKKRFTFRTFPVDSIAGAGTIACIGHSCAGLLCQRAESVRLICRSVPIQTRQHSDQAAQNLQPNQYPQANQISNQTKSATQPQGTAPTALLDASNCDWVRGSAEIQAMRLIWLEV